jgi:ketosteroid isomerase-like protein
MNSNSCDAGNGDGAENPTDEPHVAEVRLLTEVDVADDAGNAGGMHAADATDSKMPQDRAEASVPTMSWDALEQSVRRYFAMWETCDFSDLDKLFAQDCRYEECYGPVYRGLQQMHRWIGDMLAKQVVDSWDIHEMMHGLNPLGLPALSVTWTFSGREKEPYIFDGVSIIEFNDEGRMCRVREFEAQHSRVFPYGDK